MKINLFLSQAQLKYRISLCLLLCVSSTLLVADEWKAQVLPVELTVGYAVRTIDLNRDGRLDIVIADSKRILWLENPSWQTHVIHQSPEAKSDNVCMAPMDIDQDGDLDLALGYDWQPNNTQSGGAVGWLESPSDPKQAWTRHSIIENEPTTHRMNWADVNDDGRPELIVAPLKGRLSQGPGFEDRGVRLLAFDIPKNPITDRWQSRVLDESMHVMHNFEVVDFDNDKKDDLIVASFEGVHSMVFDNRWSKKLQTQLGVGNQGKAPARGSSEVRLGKLPDSRRFLATIEPWHGNQVVVYEQSPTAPWTREVIDEQLRWGHAVACCNLDTDPEDELVIGVRDDMAPHRCGVRIYDRDLSGHWQRALVEPGQVAVEDLVCADLDGDSRPEVIAVGRATHNAVIYSKLR
jgi:hypothetical protein